MDLQHKQEIVSSLREKFKSSTCAIVADYHGMNVTSLQKLRQEIRRQGLELQVVKNTLLVKAAKDFQFASDLLPYLRGMTAVAWGREDPGAPARIIRDFQREDERLKVKCGLLEGKVLNPGEVALLASLPTKDQIKASLLALLTTPPQRFLALLQAPLSNFLCLLQNYGEKLEGKA
jgi:large subunit ribosomal protein L10